MTLLWSAKYLNTFKICIDSWQYHPNDWFLLSNLYLSTCLPSLLFLGFYILLLCYFLAYWFIFSFNTTFFFSFFTKISSFIKKKVSVSKEQEHIYNWALCGIVKASTLLFILGILLHTQNRCFRVLVENVGSTPQLQHPQFLSPQM